MYFVVVLSAAVMGETLSLSNDVFLFNDVSGVKGDGVFIYDVNSASDRSTRLLVNMYKSHLWKPKRDVCKLCEGAACLLKERIQL